MVVHVARSQDITRYACSIATVLAYIAAPVVALIYTIVKEVGRIGASNLKFFIEVVVVEQVVKTCIDEILQWQIVGESVAYKDIVV